MESASQPGSTTNRDSITDSVQQLELNDKQQIDLDVIANLPGVYRMYDKKQKILYVGKAKNLKKRVQSYFRKTLASNKTASMMRLVASLDTTVTHTESEALLLEQNLIKQHKPRFNILLRDDKSYPFLYLSNHKDFPYLAYRRSNKAGKGRLFGPYSNSYAVKSSLNLLQKIFKLRQCSDAFFSNRSRPCLQHQIGRCSAPCVDMIDAQDYQRDVQMAILSIEGKNNTVIEQLQATMNQYAAELNYEQAAQTRDKIATLREIQKHQAVSQQSGDVDIIALHSQDNLCSLHQMLVRSGKIIGSFNRYPRIRLEVAPDAILEQYIVQQYLLSDTISQYPQSIITSHQIDNAQQLENVFQQQIGIKIQITHSVRKDKAAWLKLATINAEQSVKAQLNHKRTHHGRLQKLAEALGMKELPKLFECYDISHTFGEATYASRVVFDHMGPKKSNYRLYAIEQTNKGDDYASMREVIGRRFSKLQDDGPPDLLCIDGGKGQLSSALQQLEGLSVAGLAVLGIAKGEGRKPGLEKLFFTRVGSEKKPAEITLAHDSPALHLIQHIRDEAHRFAITNHRKKRAKTRKRSLLEDIPGVGVVRRQQLISHFGGRKGVISASPTDLAKVQGISSHLAQQIYQHLREKNQ